MDGAALALTTPCLPTAQLFPVGVLERPRQPCYDVPAEL